MDIPFTFKTKHRGYRRKKCFPTFPWPWKLLKVNHILTHSQTHTHSLTHTHTHTFQKNWLPCLTLCHFRRGRNWQKEKGWKIVNATFPTNTTWLTLQVSLSNYGSHGRVGQGSGSTCTHQVAPPTSVLRSPPPPTPRWVLDSSHTAASCGYPPAHLYLSPPSLEPTQREWTGGEVKICVP